MRKTILDIIVEDSQGKLIEGTKARIRPVQGGRYSSTKTGKAGHQTREDLEPGTYEVNVEGPKGFTKETRTLQVHEGHQTAVVHLGRNGERAYDSHDGKVYFKPDAGSFLLAVRGPDAHKRTTALLKHAKVEHADARRHPGSGNNAYVRVFPGASAREAKTAEGNDGPMRDLVDVLRRQGLKVIPALVVERGETIEGLTDRLVVRFHDHVTKEQVRDLSRKLGLEVQRSVAYAGNAYVLVRADGPSYDLLDLAEELASMDEVAYAEPDLLMEIQPDYTPNDPLWNLVDHLPLINGDNAWDTMAGISTDLRGGSPDVAIAVFDGNGVAPDHPDLTGPLTDGSEKLITSFDFVSMSAQTVANLDGDHGTQCAGSATARFDNGVGTAGVAPNCRLIGAELPSPVTGIEMADAFIWAAGFNTGNTDPSFPAPPSQPADVISNSWGVNNGALGNALRDCFDFLTVYGRGGKGCVVTFSTGNLGYQQFSNVRRYAAYERTIAVGASINVNPTSPVNSSQADPNGNTNNIAVAVDTRTLFNPFGPEMDIVAPSHTCYNADGTGPVDPITSTVRVGTGTLDGCSGASTCMDYATSFGGTSHASPTVAGAAALVLSARPELNWVQVRDVLRRSAVRIDAGQTNAVGQYQDLDGDGVAEFSQWYGFGRLDVDAAVQLALADDLADIVVRENLTDDGTVPSTGWHAVSPDIWVRRTDDPVPVVAYNSDGPHQNPQRGQDNYVYCRVRNNGPVRSGPVYVRAMITHFPGFEFRYPQEFIPTNRPGDPAPTPMEPGTYLIGEQRVDGVDPGEDVIVKMTWPEALVPPSTIDVGGTTVTWHPCLLLEASPHDGPDPAGATFDIKRDNNIAQRNIGILDAATGDVGVAMGTSSEFGVRQLVLDRTLMPRTARVLVRMADPRVMKRLLAAVEAMEKEPEPRHAHERQVVELLTGARIAIGVEHHKEPVVITAAAGTRMELACELDAPRSALRVVEHRGHKAIEIGHSDDFVEVPLLLRPNEFQLALFSVEGAKGSGELRLTQRRGDGELSGGYTVAF